MKTTTKDMDTVKQVIDLKGPLKGKGGSLAQWREETLARLQEVYSAMGELSQEAKSVQGRRWSMNVYRLRDARQLRWRMTNSSHATWAVIEPMLANMAPGLAQWYRQAEEVAQILNHREQVLRYELKTVERLATIGARNAQSYRGTVGRGVGGGRPRARSSGDSTTLDHQEPKPAALPAGAAA